MTQPRMFPDRPRVTAEARTWALAAKDAGASIWQVAVFVQHAPNTMYHAIARERQQGEGTDSHRRGWKLRKLNQRGLLLPAGVRFRCRCGGASDLPDGHAACREAA